MTFVIIIENQCQECVWATFDRPHAAAFENEGRNDKFSGMLIEP